jgi:hypothetical protein
VSVSWVPPCSAAEGRPLPPRAYVAVSRQIDREIDQQLAEARVPASPPAGDAEFLRRVYLDITGCIPGAAQTAAFLDDPDPQKRSKLIDELLASPAYGEHFAGRWIRRVPRNPNSRPYSIEPFERWLAEQFNQDRNWGQIVTDMVTVTGSYSESPQGVFFTMVGNDKGFPSAREAAAGMMSVFLGLKQLQCAECHNHPYDKWMQTDFWGVAAFFGNFPNTSNRGPARSIQEDRRPRPASITIPEASMRKVRKMAPVPAKFPDGQEPKLEPAVSFRPAFAAWLTSPENPYFAPNTVNRLWAHFFGRGFVNPLDDFREDNPPSHPALLQLLARELIAAGFDQKHLIRVLCNSQAYQRSSRVLPGNKQDTTLFSRMYLKVLEPDVFYAVLCQALETPDLELFGRPARPPRDFPTPRAQFVKFFTTKEAEDEAGYYSHGIPQALRLLNHEKLNAGSRLVDRLLQGGQSPDAVIEGIYLTVLSRRPTAEELKETAAHVARQHSPRQGYDDVVWALINGGEFIMNH